MMGELCGDESYVNGFKCGEEGELGIGGRKYDVGYEEGLKIYEDENEGDDKIWKVRRKEGKEIGFGVIYGIGGKLVGVKLCEGKCGMIVRGEEGEKEMDILFGEDGKVKRLLKKEEKLVRKNG